MSHAVSGLLCCNLPQDAAQLNLKAGRAAEAALASALAWPEPLKRHSVGGRPAKGAEARQLALNGGVVVLSLKRLS